MSGNDNGNRPAAGERFRRKHQHRRAFRAILAMGASPNGVLRFLFDEKLLRVGGARQA